MTELPLHLTAWISTNTQWVVIMYKFQVAALIFFLVFTVTGYTENVVLQNKQTLTPVELKSNDTLNFILNNGRNIEFVLLSTRSEIVFTTLENPKSGGRGEGTIYKISARVKIDGQEMEMQRIIPVQEAFAVPYLVNGCYIWFDGLKSIGEQLKKGICRHPCAK